MTDLLLYKNEKYGDSALKPNNIFYKGDATNSILIRLDDKVGRIKNNPDIAVNDVCDIIGYILVYLKISTKKKWLIFVTAFAQKMKPKKWQKE